MQQSSSHQPLTKGQLLGFFGMIVGMFMAILDIQIVASSLTVIASGLNATLDELSWVQTSYIIAEVIIIPLTGFTARLLSTRIAFSIASLGFTIMSILCSLAWNIESMIFFRALQGLFGGAMIPTVFATIYIIFPPEKRPTVSIIIGLVVTVAPTLGPTIGGYITEVLSWHFMFLLNVIPGIFVTTVVMLNLEIDKPNYSLLKNFDYIGITLLTISLGSLQYTLEEGASKGWFDDNHILTFSLISLVSFIALLIYELKISNPILDLRAFKHWNFTVGCLLSGVIGIGLYGAVFLSPMFLARSAGLSTFQIGVIMSVTGICQFISAPVAGNLFKKGVDPRVILAIGLSLFSYGSYLNSFLTPECRYWELFLPQAIRGFSLMFCFIPINDIALGTMPLNEVQNASGLYNLMRNLGGATGLAILNSNVITQTKIVYSYISNNLDITNPIVQNNIEAIGSMLSTRVANSDQAALLLVNSIMTRDSFIIAINKSFFTIALVFILTLFLIPLVKKVQPIGGDSGAH